MIDKSGLRSAFIFISKSFQIGIDNGFQIVYINIDESQKEDQNMEQTKNTITLKVKNEDITLYNFNKLDIYVVEGVGVYNVYYRILCGNKYYYYLKNVTSIQSIEVK